MLEKGTSNRVKFQHSLGRPSSNTIRVSQTISPPVLNKSTAAPIMQKEKKTDAQKEI